ncbi:HEAT repeat domain-containing protein [Sphingobium nicotianae]|uniref:HEAT repeat domain-containing protein n=1 Tax=Sphingobium nicotianae TaxID=2782607 RepID=A0A9X1DEZ3_9SPHN|nr:HEAT repeat domain-containing protein [Sphingobium nicotianae]MBT2188705.1 hypothetical protein [Sphingobium nicotianae]
MATAPGKPRHARQRMLDAVAEAAAASHVDEAAECLAPLFADIDWLFALATHWIAPMRGDPAALPTQSAVRSSGSILSMTLAAQPPVRLALGLIEGAAERGDDGERIVGQPHISFSGARGLYRLLSPTPVEAMLGKHDGDRLHTRAISLLPGQWLSLDERHETLRIEPQDRPVLMLHGRIDRRPAPPIRRLALDDGRPLGTVQGDDGFARAGMLMSVLRAAGTREAIPVLIGMLDRPSGRERWTVMRELLALDAIAAWPYLARMAAHDPDEGVRHAAQAVLARHGSIGEAA